MSAFGRMRSQAIHPSSRSSSRGAGIRAERGACLGGDDLFLLVDERDANAKRPCDFRQGLLRRVAQAALDPADVGLLHAGALRQRRLGKLLTLPEHGDLAAPGVALAHDVELGDRLGPLGVRLSFDVAEELGERGLLHAYRLCDLTHIVNDRLFGPSGSDGAASGAAAVRTPSGASWRA